MINNNEEYIDIIIKENGKEYINIIKKIKFTNVNLKNIKINDTDNKWWRKQYIYEKYIDNKNLKWWEKDYICNKFNLPF